MRHAFDHPLPAFHRAQPGHIAPPATGWTRGGILLMVLCFAPVLLAVWLGSIQHNWQCGSAAVRHSLAAGPRAGRPLFLVGSAAGVVLVAVVAFTGGAATAAEIFSQPAMWIILLLPEIAWAGPLLPAWALLPLRRPLWSLARISERGLGAFE